MMPAGEEAIRRGGEQGRRREEFDYHVVNRRNDLEGTVKVIQGILSAERARVRTRTIET